MSPEATSNEALVVFTPSGKRGRFSRGTGLLAAARRLGVDVDSVCGGRALCGRCQITVAEGSFAKHGIASAAGHLSAATDVERRYAERKGLGAGRRLSCQALVEGDLVIDVPPESQLHRQVVRKSADARAVALDPVLRLYYVEVDQPDMHHARGDLERLAEALDKQWGLTGLAAELDVLQKLQAALRRGAWKVTVAVHDGTRIIAVWPGYQGAAYGLAVDIGSTTIAAHLTDLLTGETKASAGLMNPQIRFGEDLMSRVSYVMMNPGGEVEMTRAVRDAVSQLAAEVAEAAGIDLGLVLEMVVVGNPIMHHLFLGIDPTQLGMAPFALAVDGALDLPARELGQSALHPGARIYVLPCIAGHVGADAAGMVLAQGPHLTDDMLLLVDVGTNAEIVLGNRERLLACSSPTGPAFEGAQISAGQRAAPGAIERVRIDRATLEPRFKVIGSDLWSDEPGFLDAVALSGVTGICGSGIIEVVAELFLAGIVTADGVIDGRLAARTARIEATGRTFSYLLHDGEPVIRVTQGDIRAIQLAKAALHAGCRLLMDRLGIERVDRIMLAGAFGSHIDPLHALVLGLVPDCEPARVHSVGNAAGTGARIALLNRAARREIEGLVDRIEKVETAIEPEFQRHFVEAMAFPHKTAPYTALAQVITLPTQEPRATGERERRRRREPA